MAGMKDISSAVKTTTPATPMIYSYTTPQIHEHDGWTKIGYTEQDVDTRIKQQTKTANIKAVKQWAGRAEYDDGLEPLVFKDHQFHGYLTKLGIERLVDDDGSATEWFHVDGPTGKRHFFDFRQNRGILETDEPMPYQLREEQQDCVDRTFAWLESHDGDPYVEYLWNAKPRFGKTLTAYSLVQRLKAKMVLVLTNRPSIADSWYSDYDEFLGTQSGYYFVSETSSIASRPHVISRADFVHKLATSPKSDMPGCIEFVSLQDLKGGLDFGGKYDKLAHVKDIKWDLVILDEAHEGVDTMRSDVALSQIKRRFTLYLSGTPFKALANDKFPEKAIFNWTYAEEQAKKRDWAERHPGEANPYADLPQLNMFTYKMSDIVATVAGDGIEIDGETHEYAFDLNEFFACDPATGNFVHDADVDRFLDALCTQTKYPFSTPELRDELRHTFWMVGGNPRPSDSARALMKKLRKHPVFKDYKVILAVGDGDVDSAVDDDKLDRDKADREALARVRKAIATHDRTITLSVGQLTTGVTVPEWCGVLMLSNMKSPSLYIQAAFRAQNPCLFHEADGTFRRKENAYVFDFDPARTLDIYEQFANDLYAETSGGKGDVEEHKRHVKELLNFFPVLGEDEDGEMVELKAEQVLLIPRKIHAVEVVRHGFISNFLFQNIGRIFNAPKAVVDLIYGIDPYTGKLNADSPSQDEVDYASVNKEGEVEVPQDTVIGLAQGLFGKKVYGDVAEDLTTKIDDLTAKAAATVSDEDKALDAFIDEFVSSVSDPIMEAASSYTQDLTAGHRKRVEKKIKADTQVAVTREVGIYKAARNRIDHDHDVAVAQATTEAEMHAAHDEYQARMDEAQTALKDSLKEARDTLVESAGTEVVKAVETAKREEKKATIEEDIRKHLNGFARTIPAFLMAFGDEKTTLANFDEMVEPDVFEEVTRNPRTGFCITLDQFRLFRDGGDIANPETGEMEHFDGHLFDEVVFDDSVQEFMRLRRELADYFDEAHDHDIFDYIPNQKTNQVFTPRWVVRLMADKLEAENPGCFDNVNATFADLYMKSGLYITEIAKRLFKSDALKAAFPDDDERRRHIFEHQLYGMAPSRIIYLIATNYIFGFDTGDCIDRGHFVECDAAEASKDGTLSTKVDEYFGLV
ncbi:MAG: DEAD/DEAH box helicase family protein [Bifidobacteriaceae bacterium]|nr:DEAD/DEAH box helicase family protein [Bifidobacteriaceae bacterium]